jgi:hypothetical protein
MAAANLTDAYAAYQADAPIASRTRDPEVQARRDFMAGAMAYHQLRRTGASPEALLAELIGFGRAVGTAAERASA